MNSEFHIGSNLREFTLFFYRSSKGFDGLNINVIHALFHGELRCLGLWCVNIPWLTFLAFSVRLNLPNPINGNFAF